MTDLCESQVRSKEFDRLKPLDAIDEAVREAPCKGHVTLFLVVAGKLNLLVNVLLDVAVHLLEGLDEGRIFVLVFFDLFLERLESLEDLLFVHVPSDGDVGVLGPVVLLVVVPNLE